MNPFAIFSKSGVLMKPDRPIPQESPSMEAGAIIRFMDKDDLPSVAYLEQQSYDHPRTLEELVYDLRGNHRSIGIVAACGCGCNVVYGYMTFEVHQHYYLVTALAVRKQLRRQGIGRQFIDYLKRSMRQHQRSTIRADVHEANLCGQLFLKACGLRAVDVWNEPDCDGSLYRFVHRMQPSERQVETARCRGV